MLKRTLTAIVAMAILIPVLIFSDTWVFPIAISLIVGICLYEIFKCIGMGKRYAVVAPLYVFGLAAPICARLLQDTAFLAAAAFIALSLYTVYLFALIIWSHGKLTVGEAAPMLVLSVYIIAALTAIVCIHDFSGGGRYVYLLIFLGAWITDTFAYFTGYFLGRHKLIEDVSPKKTIEGSIGGIVFCAASFAVFGLVIDRWFDGNANILFLIICGILLSIVSQIGDLIMSVIKRHYQIKDYGKLFPGHGGMLDRFDSILAVSLCLGAVCVFSALTGILLI